MRVGWLLEGRCDRGGGADECGDATTGSEASMAVSKKKTKFLTIKGE